MTTTLTPETLAAIPPELASAFGIKEGTQLEWTDAGDGLIIVKLLRSRGERARELMGEGRRWLKPGQDPIADLIRERVEEDEEEEAQYDAPARHLGVDGSLPR
jgi:bifunctional DNA-binding transcriptional regulator/antitoxin component of YhaV-PrlF toxin-antitoxin module